LGARALERGEFAEAAAAFRRASRLAGDGERRTALGGRVVAVQRQRSKSDGHFYLEQDASEAAPPEAGARDSGKVEEPSTLPRVLFLVGVFLLIGWERFFRGGRWLLGMIRRGMDKARHVFKGPMKRGLLRLGALTLKGAQLGARHVRAAAGALRAEFQGPAEARGGEASQAPSARAMSLDSPPVSRRRALAEGSAQTADHHGIEAEAPGGTR